MSISHWQRRLVVRCEYYTTNFLAYGQKTHARMVKIFNRAKNKNYSMNELHTG